MINTRLGSWLIVGSLILAGGQFVLLNSDDSNPKSANSNARPSVMAATLESTDSSAQVRIQIPGFSGTPKLQVLPSPDRLVVDFHGVVRGKAVSANDLAVLAHPFILNARLAQFTVKPQLVTRLVLELVPGVQAVVHPDSQGVSIALTKGTGKIRASLSEKSLPSMENPIVNPVVSSAYSQDTIITAPILTDSHTAVNTASEANNLKTNAIEREAAFSLNGGSVEELPQIGSPYIGLPSLGFVPIAPVAAQGFVSSVDPLVPTRQTAVQRTTSNITAMKPDFSGERISLDVHNTDLRTVLTVIANTAGLNLVMDPEVQQTGGVYKFSDNPWDQILDTVIKAAGLGMEIKDGILRVAKMEKFKKEEDDRKMLEEARALSGEMVTEIRSLSYARADDVVKIIDNFKSSNRGKVLTDARTNNIIMTDLPKNIEVMQGLLDQLDVRVPQVQIDVRMVEANRGWEKAFGVSWPQSSSTGGSADLQVNGQNPSWGANNSPSWNSVNSRSTGDNSLGMAFSPGRQGVTSIPSPAGEIWVSFLSNRISLNAIIQALQKDNQIKIVSEPKLVASNNNPGIIDDGSKIPYQAMQGGMASGAISVEFMDAMLSLTVTPQITNDGRIILDVDMKKEQPDWSRQVNGMPAILKKGVKTRVIVDDGGTAVLGGVYTNQSDSGTVGVPFLSKLPGLGFLFRSKTNNDRTTEMLVFISPKIIQ